MAISREAARAYDASAIAAGVPGAVLMETAARGVVDLLLGLGAHGPVSIACGKGNNGGDGFVIARMLRGLGRIVSVELLVAPDELRGDAAAAFAALTATDVPIQRDPNQRLARLRMSQWTVDALLGTGATGTVRPPFDAAIGQINAAGRQVMAVDLPSGLDADTGLPLGEAVRAHHTATFFDRKLGFENPRSVEYTGQVHVIDLGVGALVPR